MTVTESYPARQALKGFGAGAADELLEAGDLDGLAVWKRILRAVVNAVLDALKEEGVRHIDMPLTPEKVWRAIRDRGAVDPAGLMGDVV